MIAVSVISRFEAHITAFDSHSWFIQYLFDERAFLTLKKSLSLEILVVESRRYLIFQRNHWLNTPFKMDKSEITQINAGFKPIIYNWFANFQGSSIPRWRKIIPPKLLRITLKANNFIWLQLQFNFIIIGCYILIIEKCWVMQLINPYIFLDFLSQGRYANTYDLSNATYNSE